jgi:ATP/maltotriose-dependent transcriptional regulator MalT
VARPRLAEALREGLAGGLILVSAPAGFGKTALLADWIRRESRPTGWLSLDSGDNDPARFWRHVAAALDRVCPGIGERVGPLLGPPPPHSFEGPVTALINELASAAGDDEVLLVLDDYHVIEAGPVHASVDAERSLAGAVADQHTAGGRYLAAAFRQTAWLGSWQHWAASRRARGWAPAQLRLGSPSR